MSTTDRPIHPGHRKGLQGLINSTLNMVDKPSVAPALLNALVAPGVTYGELGSVTERAMLRAIDRVQAKEDVEIPETRVDALLALFPLVTPGLLFCNQCGALNLQLKAGKWITLGGPCSCGKGVFQLVEFDAPVIAWTTGRSYDPGTTVDENHIPLTSEGILEYLRGQNQGLHPTLASALSVVDPTHSLEIVEICRYLVHGQEGPHLQPIPAMKFLGNPMDLVVNVGALATLLQKVQYHAGQTVTLRENGTMVANTPVVVAPPTPAIYTTGTQAVEPRQFRGMFAKALGKAYPRVEQIEQVVEAIGMSMGSIATNSGTEYIWHDVIRQSESHGTFGKLFRHALADKPTVFGPLCAAYIDTTELHNAFGRLDMYTAKQVARETGLSDFLCTHHESHFMLHNAIQQHGSLKALYERMIARGIMQHPTLP